MKSPIVIPRFLVVAAWAALLAGGAVAAAPDDGGIAWSSWRGPQQNGTSLEIDLPDTWTVNGENHLWTYPISGRGTPAIANGRVYCLGYSGDGAELQEVLVCLDEATGRRIWELRFNDFLSDSVYSRYAIGAPTVDPRTGNVFCLTTPGLLVCVAPDGTLLWEHSMMEEFGRMTFPNSRTGSPVIYGDLVIMRGITSNWGKQGPARDRFFAFETDTGRPVWACTPGIGPKDNSFSHPVLERRDGRDVLYAGTGCGNVVCIDAQTGTPIWRFPMSIGGVNSAVLVAGDTLIAIHGRENFDSSIIGRMVAIHLGPQPAGAASTGPAVLGAADELWRNDLAAFSSSPVLVGDRIYLTDQTGELCCVNATTGAVLWKQKLAPDQIHAAPVYGDGKLYVPMNNGSFYIIEPSDAGPTVLAELQLEGNCLGAPAIAGGRVFVQTTRRLYCFGAHGRTTASPPDRTRTYGVGEPSALVCAPSDVLLRPGEAVDLEAWSVDAHGGTLRTLLRPGMRPGADGVKWVIPANLDVRVVGAELRVDPAGRPGAGVVKAESSAGVGEIRVRIVPDLPITQDFEEIALTTPHPTDGVNVAFPPSEWIGARLKWDVRELDGNAVLAKTLDRALFQRTMAFIGHPDSHDYTVQIDVMSDGNRRSMSTAGVVNQRYMIQLKGNHQEIEISSNMERIKETVPFRWKPKVWYRLKTRVDTQGDGSAIVRAKAWPRDDPEPDAWNIEYTHATGHTHGAPGLFGFAPQSRFRVYVDNIMVTQND